MVKNNIRIYLASHHHSSHVVAFPLKNVNKLISRKCNVPKPDSSIPLKSNTGCAFIDPSLIKNSGTILLNQECGLKNYEFKTEFKNEKGYFYVFVAGNGGRYFDPMTDSSVTRSTLIWGKGAKDNTLADHASQKYGGLYIKFNQDHMEAVFFEENNMSPNEIATFKITKCNEGDCDNLRAIDTDIGNKCTETKKKLKKNK